jgi:hypothetical protein
LQNLKDLELAHLVPLLPKFIVQQIGLCLLDPILNECVSFMPNLLFGEKILLIWLTSIDQAGPLDFIG